MFLKFEIAENVLELQKIPHIFEKMPYLKPLLMILTYSTIFTNLRTNKLYLYTEIIIPLPPRSRSCRKRRPSARPPSPPWAPCPPWRTLCPCPPPPPPSTSAQGRRRTPLQVKYQASKTIIITRRKLLQVKYQASKTKRIQKQK